jgi:hypothetical protein
VVVVFLAVMLLKEGKPPPQRVYLDVFAHIRLKTFGHHLDYKPHYYLPTYKPLLHLLSVPLPEDQIQ